MAAELPFREAERLQALRDLAILDTAPERIFDNIVRLAATNLEMPIALLSFVDEHRLWFKARVGIDASETSRCPSFCDRAILEPESPFVVESTDDDTRFDEHPLVTDAPHIRFYAGAVVSCPFLRVPIGTLCVIDREPRSVSEQQRDFLNTLAEQVEHMLEMRALAMANDAIARSLAESDAKVRGIIDNSQNLLGLISTDGVLLDTNRTAVDSIGVPIDDVLGKPFWETPWWTHCEDLQERLKTAIRRAAEGETDRFAATHDTHDGGFIEVEFSISPVVVDGEVAYLIPEGRDVTLQKQREREAERYMAELRESNYELEQFAYVASHDLRSPLRGIAALVNFIEEDEGDRLSETSKESFARLHRRLLRMRNLLDDLLAYSRLGHSQQQVVEVDVNDLLDEVLDLLSIPAGFEVRVESSLPTLTTYATPLRQVFINMIGNAVKHHDRDTGAITVSATSSTEGTEFRVTDDGPGIEESHREQVFEMFRTLRSRDKVEGSGMGLAIVRKLVRRFGGNVTIEPGPGRGTTFVFTWPTRLSVAETTNR